jgi:hypothetical protein
MTDAVKEDDRTFHVVMIRERMPTNNGYRFTNGMSNCPPTV